MKATLPVLCILSSAPAVWAAPARSTAVSQREAKQWVRHLIPLPKQIALSRAVRVPAAEVAVRLREDAGDVETHAAELLAGVWKGKVGAGPARFEILLGVCDAAGKIGDVRVPGAEKLAGLPNADQAYAIAPVGDGRLALAGRTEQGVTYAATTLAHLVRARLAGDTLTLPLARVLDWPDLAERGEWGGNAGSDIEWMARHKMNLVEMHCTLTVTPEGRGQAQVQPEAVEQGRLSALKVVPILTHLDQITGTGIYRLFPELRGKGASAQVQGYPDDFAPCLSQPKVSEVIADWMVSLAAQKGVSDICAWLSENAVQCECEGCRQAGQFVLETRALVKAWRLARERNPRIRLRILLTQGSYKTNDKVLAEVPPEVGVTYYDGGRTYDSSRDPMIYPLLEQYAAGGRWLGCYPQITASWRIVCPWSGPQFIKARMTEFVQKKLQCLCGYATPHNRLYDFNVAAAAEWSWNSTGRDEREFAAAWATTRGLKDPELAADWAVLLGPVGWDVYGSGVPYNSFFGGAARMVGDRAKPILGKGLFRYFDTEERLRADAAACEKAMAMARRLDSPAILAETQVISGYVRMVQQLYAITSLVSRPAPPTNAERAGLNADLRAFAEAGMQVVAGLQEWEKACGAEIGGSRLSDTLNVTEQTVVDVGKALRPFGVRDAGAAYLRQQIGTWEDNDFEKSEKTRKTWEVTASLVGPGTYQVRFDYTRGWHGLTIARAALSSTPKDAPENLTEVIFDQHSGLAACQNRANVYTLPVPAVEEGRRYFLVADIQGVRSSDKPEDRRGCAGAVTFWKVRPPGEALPEMPLLPMAESEVARFYAPRFGKGGVRVGVFQGGYGSESVLAYLRGRPGIDAQPLHLLNATHLKACQVVVLPQPRLPERVDAAAVAALTQFLRAGGGLLTTHNAVGYRGLPVLAPEVCVRGVNNVREPGWRVEEAEHPVTQELARGKSLARTYYDHITLEPGPAGTVVARGAPSGAAAGAGGPAGKGRYVACGLAIGLGVADDTDVAPSPDEGRLLENAVRWAGGGK